MPRNTSKDKQPRWDPNLAALVDHMLDGSIKVKQAVEVGRRAVEYFRGGDYCRWLLKNREHIIKKYSEALDGNTLSTVQDAEELGTRLIRKGFFYRAQYKPLDGMVEQGENGELKRPKWPKRLAMTACQVFDDRGFYVILYEGSKSWHYIMLTLLILTVLVLCMFPAWPLSIKLGVWYVSVFFMTFILALVFGRLVIFVFFWFFGLDLWILPNLFNEDAGIIDSFVPVLDIIRRKDDWIMFAGRIFCAFLVAAGVYKLGETHSVSDVGYFAKQSLLDVLDWGHQKLAAVPENKPKYPSLNDIEGATKDAMTDKEGESPEAAVSETPEGDEDYSCLRECGFQTFEQLMESCLMECSCMERLTRTPCYEKCPDDTKKTLEEASLDACHSAQDRRRKKKQEL